ncbi:hypothetical protein EGY05_06150 [Chryseobacterium arthrosphaerae]|nr:hypothetical protein EGY05_06150 [Chryseobacterium arthrosphaerae]
MASAEEIFDNVIKPAKSFTSTEKLISLSIPFKCLFCCDLQHEVDFDTFLKSYFKTIGSEKGKIDIRKLPAYVTELLTFSNEIPSWYYKEFERDFIEFIRLIIVDNRNKPV